MGRTTEAIVTKGQKEIGNKRKRVCEDGKNGNKEETFESNVRIRGY